MTSLEITLLILVALLTVYTISLTIFYRRQISYLFRVIDVKNKDIEDCENK